MILLKNVIYLKKNLKYFLEFEMKKKVLVYKSGFSLPDEITIGIVSATPNRLLKRLFTGKKFNIKCGELSIKSGCSIEEQLPYIQEQLKVLIEKL